MWTLLDVATSSFSIGPALLIFIVIIVLLEWAVLALLKTYRPPEALLMAVAANILSWAVGFVLAFQLDIDYFETLQMFLLAFTLSVFIEGGFMLLLRRKLPGNRIIPGALAMNIVSYIALYLFMML